jgi:hypothetical protein
MNASTFTARVIASTGADVAAALSGAIGAMSGPLHGGAPSACCRCSTRSRRPATPGVRQGLLDRGERLMGFGHRVYRAEDPRARVLRRTAKELGAPATRSPRRWSRPRSPSCASAARPVLETNVEFWAAVVLDFAEVPAAHVHVDVHLRPHRRLVGAHPGAEAHRPADPPVGEVRTSARSCRTSADLRPNDHGSGAAPARERVIVWGSDSLRRVTSRSRTTSCRRRPVRLAEQGAARAARRPRRHRHVVPRHVAPPGAGEGRRRPVRAGLRELFSLPDGYEVVLGNGGTTRSGTPPRSA